MSSNNSNHHLTYVIDTQEVGGTERYLLDLCQRMSKKYSVTVICPKNKKLDVWVEKIQKYGIEIVRARIAHVFDF